MAKKWQSLGIMAKFFDKRKMALCAAKSSGAYK